MKKTLVLVFICAIISLFLVGCGGHSDSEHPSSEHPKADHPQ